MSELEADFMKSILDTLIEKGDPFYPVSSLAHDLDAAENERGECASLTSKFVSHMLQLEDLGCIRNMLGGNSWGYDPLGEEQEINHDGYNNGNWQTPHCYEGDHYTSVIRITATGRQLRDALNTDEVPQKAKKALISLGGGAARDILTKILVDAFAG